MQKFQFTSYTWHEVEQKVRLFVPIQRLITTEFALSTYTPSEKIKNVCFAFLINPENYASIFKFSDRFAWRKGDVYLYAKIPYEIFEAADDKTAIRLMCEAYLASILRIPALKGMKKINFDAQKLHDDLQNYFKEKEFL